LQLPPIFTPEILAIIGVVANSIEDGAVLCYCLPSNTHAPIALFGASVDTGLLVGRDFVVILASSFVTDFPAMITRIFVAIQGGLGFSCGIKAMIIAESFILNSRIFSEHLTSGTYDQACQHYPVT